MVLCVVLPSTVQFDISRNQSKFAPAVDDSSAPAPAPPSKSFVIMSKCGWTDGLLFQKKAKLHSFGRSLLNPVYSVHHVQFRVDIRIFGLGARNFFHRNLLQF